MNKTKIEWVKNPDGTQGYTWNPVTGCLNGCEYCYARKLANGRLKSRYLANKNFYIPEGYEGMMKGKGNILVPEQDPFYPRFWDKRIDEPLLSIKRRGIFVCDMSDLFGIGIPEDWTRRVLEVINTDYELNGEDANRFYLLTKQPQNLIKFSHSFPCWVGVTATANAFLTNALIGLKIIEAEHKFISFEPLLGAVGMNDHMSFKGLIDWVIIGALTFRGSVIGSYPQLTPMSYGTKDTLQPKMKWIDDIVAACDRASIPVFLKNNLQPLVDEVFKGAANYASPILTPDNKLRQEFPK